MATPVAAWGSSQSRSSRVSAVVVPKVRPSCPCLPLPRAPAHTRSHSSCARPAHNSAPPCVPSLPSFGRAAARRRDLITTLLDVLAGNNSGCRHLPRQFLRRTRVPLIPDVARAAAPHFHPPGRTSSMHVSAAVLEATADDLVARQGLRNRARLSVSGEPAPAPQPRP